MEGERLGGDEMPICPCCGEIMVGGDPYCPNCGTVFVFHGESDDYSKRKSPFVSFNPALNSLNVVSETSRSYFVFRSSMISLLLIAFLQQFIISYSCCSKK
ncbi:hypothetical protein [uncultured Methanobrevibacter sp.]|uniref:hypothetical protein n=1 Tax=uncultured Methanobrevibacter sp. TaxID=253161 RepID=UPI002630F285|nr:hypothetical protein [uncultured Methanobrevibacter sp.]